MNNVPWFDIVKIDARATNLALQLVTGKGNEMTKEFLVPIVNMIVEAINQGVSDKSILNQLMTHRISELLAMFAPLTEALERHDLALSHIDFEKLRKPLAHIIKQIREQVKL